MIDASVKRVIVITTTTAIATITTTTTTTTTYTTRIVPYIMCRRLRKALYKNIKVRMSSTGYATINVKSAPITSAIIVDSFRGRYSVMTRHVVEVGAQTRFLLRYPFTNSTRKRAFVVVIKIQALVLVEFLLHLTAK